MPGNHAVTADLQCPHCGAALRKVDASPDGFGRCLNCGERFRIQVQPGERTALAPAGISSVKLTAIPAGAPQNTPPIPALQLAEAERRSAGASGSGFLASSGYAFAVVSCFSEQQVFAPFFGRVPPRGWIPRC
jgi:hypothetical protein